MKKLSHVDAQGKAVMVDVGDKTPQRRTARAAGHIALQPGTVASIRANALAKGDVLAVAQIAGIGAAKRTAELIPLCHPLPLTAIDVRLTVDDAGVTAVSRVRCCGPTGVEMEALTAVGVALLTVYDMCKAIDGTMRIDDIHLVEKMKEDLG